MHDLRLSEDLKRCVAFHGHLCPGVVIGYCAAQLGMRTLDARRADDEELLRHIGKLQQQDVREKLS